MEVITGLKGANAGKTIPLEDFDIWCRNILHTLAPLSGVDITEEDVKGFKQFQINEGRFKLEEDDTK